MSIKLDIDGVPIIVELAGFTPGASFFVPCLNTIFARELIQKKLAKQGFSKISIEQVVDDKKYGLRVWREE